MLGQCHAMMKYIFGLDGTFGSCNMQDLVFGRVEAHVPSFFPIILGYGGHFAKYLTHLQS